MSKVLILSDIHLQHNENWGINQLIGSVSVNSRTIQKIKKIVEIIKQEQPDVLIDSGDLFSVPNPPEYLRTLYFKNIVPLVSKVFLVSGNHNQKSGYSVGTSESKINPNITVINPGQSLVFENIVMIGYTRDNKEFNNMVIENQSVPFLITHRDPVPLSWHIAGFFGHQHEPMQIENSYSIGSPFIQNWGEEGYINRYLVIEDDKFQFKQVQDLNIKTFNKLKNVEDGLYDAIRFKIKDTAQVINAIDKKQIEKQYSKTFVSWNLEVETKEYKVNESISITESLEDILKDKNLSKEEFEFGKNVLGEIQ